jgi:hypothetical protein
VNALGLLLLFTAGAKLSSKALSTSTTLAPGTVGEKTGVPLS